MGKGSSRRPREVDLGTFEKNWENIFGRNNRNNQPEPGDRVHNEERTEIRHSESFSDRIGKSTEDSKSNTDERRVGKRSIKGSLRIQS